MVTIFNYSLPTSTAVTIEHWLSGNNSDTSPIIMQYKPIYCLSCVLRFILQQESDDDVMPSERQSQRPKTTTILPVASDHVGRGWFGMAVPVLMNIYDIWGVHSKSFTDYISCVYIHNIYIYTYIYIYI